MLRSVPLRRMRRSRVRSSAFRGFLSPVTKPSMTSSATATCSAHSKTDHRSSAGRWRQVVSLTPATLLRKASSPLRRVSSRVALSISVPLAVPGRVLIVNVDANVNGPSPHAAAVHLLSETGTAGHLNDLQTLSGTFSRKPWWASPPRLPVDRMSSPTCSPTGSKCCRYLSSFQRPHENASPFFPPHPPPPPIESTNRPFPAIKL